MEQKIIISILFTAVVMAVFMILFEEGVFNEKVKVGQIWQETCYKNNPFKKTVITKYKILAVKDGYVQYKNLKHNNKLSSGADWFIIDKVLINTSKCKFVVGGEYRETWIQDPFETPAIIRILGIKDGYIKYKHISINGEKRNYYRKSTMKIKWAQDNYEAVPKVEKIKIKDTRGKQPEFTIDGGASTYKNMYMPSGYNTISTP